MTAPELDTEGPIAIPVRREVDAAVARRRAHRVASDLGFSEAGVAAVVTAVSELATNIVFHGGGGTIEVVPVACRDLPGVEVSATDSGPGLADVLLAVRDGYSTRGGLGSGLPAVIRLMGYMTVRTAPGQGLVITARRYLRQKPAQLDASWQRLDLDSRFARTYFREENNIYHFRSDS